MQAVTFEVDGKIKTGSLVEGRVLDLDRAYDLYAESQGMEKSPVLMAAFSDMISFLKNRKDAVPISEKISEYVMGNLDISKNVLYEFEKVNLRAPIPNPQKVIVTGPSWKHFYKRARAEGRTIEFLFMLKPPTAVIGPGDNIVIPKNEKQINIEPELAVVVGKPGRYIAQDEAWDHVAGFTVFNDVTAWGGSSVRTWTIAKIYDTFAAFGPCITLKEQIGDVQNLELKARLNGEERVNYRTSEMEYPITHCITSISEVMTLEIGDVIATGCPGTFPVTPGDSVEVEIENIGTLKNQIKALKD